MIHDVPLIAILAVGLVTALATGLAATLLRLPAIVGYLLAGIAIGPFTPGFVADARLAGELAEIGVMLLMFGVGLHFSLNDLWTVRGVALPGAIVQMAIATGLGVLVARVWGWSLAAGLVMGLALAVASTVVLLRTLHQLGRQDAPEGKIAVGWLIVEDLIVIVALVLLPALASAMAPGSAAPADSRALAWVIGETLASLGIFAAFIILLGRRVLPWLLDRVVGTGSRELFTLAVVAVAIGVAYGAQQLFGVSFALGAFCAGLVVAGSRHGRRAERESRALQDVFGVLFFVSVGMLFDPAVLLGQPGRLAVLLTIVLVGKTAAAYGIVRLLGRPPATARAVATSLAQIGELSFIVSGLGLKLGVLPMEGHQLILATALISIMLNPLLMRVAAPAAEVRII